MPLSVGQPAPQFALYDTNKNKVSLSDFRGKNVILLFFPMAFTSVCTRELCEMRDSNELYNSLNAEVIGISIDTLYTLGKYKAENNLNFTLLSDFNKTATKDYDVYHQNFSYDYIGVSKRAVFVIDKNGIIRYIEVLPNLGDYPNMIALKNAVSTL
jgi:glutaredoxin-dependent peroxiredoxin